jgi:hypothetical protein
VQLNLSGSPDCAVTTHSDASSIGLPEIYHRMVAQYPKVKRCRSRAESSHNYECVGEHLVHFHCDGQRHRHLLL